MRIPVAVPLSLCFPVFAVASAATQELPFDCSDGVFPIDRPRLWSSAKQRYCCEHQRKGCTTVQTSTTSQTSITSITLCVGCNSTETSTTSQTTIAVQSTTMRAERTIAKKVGGHPVPALFDCLAQLAIWHHRWSDDKRKWCCQHRGFGCTTTVTTVTTTFTGSTTTSTLTSTNTSTGTDRSNSECFEDQISWEPLRMPNVAETEEPDAVACQWRCSKIPSCVHFSYWKAGNVCYLQDGFAVRQTSRLGFVSGPFQCWDKLNHTAFANVGENTYLPSTFKCMEVGRLYSPILGAPQYFLNGSIDEAVTACKEWCASEGGCGHWTMQFPLRLCRLARHDAHELTMENAVSGSPTSCDDKELTVSDDDVNASLNSSIIIRTAAGPGVMARGYFPILFLGCSVVVGATFLSSVMIRRASKGKRFVRAAAEWENCRSFSLIDEATAFNEVPTDEETPGPCHWMKKPEFFGRELADGRSRELELSASI